MQVPDDVASVEAIAQIQPVNRSPWWESPAELAELPWYLSPKQQASGELTLAGSWSCVHNGLNSRLAGTLEDTVSAAIPETLSGMPLLAGHEMHYVQINDDAARSTRWNQRLR